MKHVAFYGLLHVDTVKRAQFDGEIGADDRFMAYIENAITSARSIRHFGNAYRLVTNAPVGVAKRLALAGASDIEVVEHDFTWSVPRDVPFYSAHYKLELAELLATGAYGERVAVLDLDTAMIRPLTLDEDALYICDHGPRGVSPKMRADLERIAGAPLGDPGWVGGEFLLGSPADFARLVAVVKQLWERYTTNIRMFDLVSDEAPLSAAIALMKADGVRIAPAEIPGGLARHWSIRTGLPMPPLTDALEASILHLPADKDFLAEEAGHAFDPAAFTARYVAYVRRRKWDAVAKWLVAPLFGKPRQYLPR